MGILDILRSEEDFQGMDVVEVSADIDDLIALSGRAQEILGQFITGLQYATSTKGMEVGESKSVPLKTVNFTIPSELWDRMTGIRRRLKA